MAGPTHTHLHPPVEEPWQKLGDVVAQRMRDVTDARALIVKFVARVEILQAWQFNANLHDAPEWVDRNWLAYDEGPTLNVTRPDGSFAGAAKRGDWIVRQNTTVDDDTSPTGTRVLPDHIAVISGDEFRRLYRPVPESRPDAEPEGAGAVAEQPAGAKKQRASGKRGVLAAGTSVPNVPRA